ncbi:hypothetical protein K438DRAFT_1931961 [Mycena galopus ATCC 62051]|nr:hypothetical protein K438DRAFT_1931961 [Mycena galopus ATCC 62051]
MGRNFDASVFETTENYPVGRETSSVRSARFNFQVESTFPTRNELGSQKNHYLDVKTLRLARQSHQGQRGRRKRISRTLTSSPPEAYCVPKSLCHPLFARPAQEMYDSIGWPLVVGLLFPVLEEGLGAPCADEAVPKPQKASFRFETPAVCVRNVRISALTTTSAAVTLRTSYSEQRVSTSWRANFGPPDTPPSALCRRHRLGVPNTARPQPSPPPVHDNALGGYPMPKKVYVGNTDVPRPAPCQRLHPLDLVLNP